MFKNTKFIWDARRDGEPVVDLMSSRREMMRKPKNPRFFKTSTTVENYTPGSTGITFDAGSFQMAATREWYVISDISENDPDYAVEVKGYRNTLINSGVLLSGTTSGFHYSLNAGTGSSYAGSNYMNLTQTGSTLKLTGRYGFKAGAKYTLYIYNHDPDI